MKKIYILLMHTGTIPARLIKLFTKFKYSHVGISLDDNCNIIYSFGRRKVHSVINGGFVAERKEGEFFKYFKNTICKIYEIEITDEQFKNIKKIIRKMELNKDKYGYDFLGIFPRFFGKPYIRKNKYVCSYFVAYLLESANIYKFEKDVCFVEPKDFYKLKKSKEIYSGLLRKYKV